MKIFYHGSLVLYSTATYVHVYMAAWAGCASVCNWINALPAKYKINALLACQN